MSGPSLILSSGISNVIQDSSINNLTKKDRKTLDFLANKSFKEYESFKNHPKFLPYLENMSTLQYYSKTNIGSRPSKRNNSNSLIFSDLRAIPFVGSWSQLKQNVPGFFGVGSAINDLNKKGEIKSVKELFKNSSFFRTLVFNSMMSLTKSFFELTYYMEADKEYGPFWKLIHLNPTLSPFSTTGSQRIPPSNLALATSSPLARISSRLSSDSMLTTFSITADLPLRGNPQQTSNDANDKVIFETSEVEIYALPRL